MKMKLDHDSFEMVSDTEFEDLKLEYDDYYITSEIHDCNKFISYDCLDESDFDAYKTINDSGYVFGLFMIP